MKIRMSQLLIASAMLIGMAGGAPLLQTISQPKRAYAMEQAIAHFNDAAHVNVVLPNTFSYQGTLRLANGNLANGNFNVTLSVYDTVLGGTALFTQTFSPVPVRDGVFSVVVGDEISHTLPANLFDSPQLFIGIKVDPDPEMLPRQRLHPVPWAMRAKTAEVAAALSPESWTNNVTRWIGNSRQGRLEQADYPTDLKRFVVEAKDAGNTPSSVDIPDDELIKRCGDEDGCEVRLSMRNRVSAEDGSDLLTTSFPWHLSIGKTLNNQRLWRAVGFTDAGAPIVYSGVDGASGSQTVLSSGDCRVIDGVYVDGTDHQDLPAPFLGFELLNWYGTADNPNMVCVLAIND